MKISAKTEYALRAMVRIASQDGQTTLEQIAGLERIPLTIIHTVIHRLARGGLVRTSRGRGGGVALARPAGGITARQILEAIEGEITLQRCLDMVGSCPKDDGCPMRALLVRAERRLAETFENTTLAELCSADSN